MDRAVRHAERSSLLNRVLSIAHDAEFVAGVIAKSFSELPRIANLRAGAWYLQHYDEAVYFKSTDGHPGEWDFSVRRLNLHVVKLAAARNGCVVVDSTIRGRSLPDSFSKTIPIWCAVLNAVVRRLRPEKWPSDVQTGLHTPAHIVSASEHAAISALVPAWCDKLLASRVNLSVLLDTLERPLRCVWAARSIDPDLANVAHFTPIVLVSASECIRESAGAMERRVNNELQISFMYLQGAGGDEEMWSCGLTPALMWRNIGYLTGSSGADECKARVAELVGQDQEAGEGDDDEAGPSSDCAFHEIGVGSGLFVGRRRAGRPPLCWTYFDCVVCCMEVAYEGMFDGCAATPPSRNDGHCTIQCDCAGDVDVPSLALLSDDGGGESSACSSSCFFHLPAREGRRDKVVLVASLDLVVSFIGDHLRRNKRVLVHCAQGKDRSVAVALATLAVHFEDDGNGGQLRLRAHARARRDVTRALLTQYLAYLCAYRTLALPSRSTMKKLYLFFEGE